MHSDNQREDVRFPVGLPAKVYRPADSGSFGTLSILNVNLRHLLFLGPTSALPSGRPFDVSEEVTIEILPIDFRQIESPPPFAARVTHVRQEGFVVNVTDKAVFESIMLIVSRYFAFLKAYCGLTGDVFYMHDLDGQFYFINDAVRETLGYEKQDVLANPSLYAYFLPESGERVRAEMERIRQHREPLYAGKPFVLHGRHRDGTTIRLQIVFNVWPSEQRSAPSRPQQGQPWILGVARDVTKSHLSDRLGRALDDTDFVYYCADRQGIAYSVHGKKAEELGDQKGKDRRDLYLFREDRDAFLRYLAAAPGHRLNSFRLVFKKPPAETPIVVEATSNYWYDDEGHVIGVQGIYKDITPLLEDRRDGIVVVRDGEVVYCNQAFAKLAGRTPDDLLLEPFVDLFSPAEHERIHSAFRVVTKDNPRDTVEAELKVPIDQRYRRLRLEIEPFRGCDATSYWLVCRDVTQRANFERMVTTMQEGIYTLVGDRFTFVNPKFLDIVGAPSEDHVYACVGRLEMVDETDRVRVDGILRDFIASSDTVATHRYDFHVRRLSDRRLAWVETVVQREKKPDGVVYSQGTIREITDKGIIRAIDQAIDDLNRLSRMFLDGVNYLLPAQAAILLFMDPEGRSLLLQDAQPLDFLKTKGGFVPPIVLDECSSLDEAVRTRRPTEIPFCDVVGHPFMSCFDFTGQPQSCLAIPMPGRDGRVIGVVLAFTEGGESFKKQITAVRFVAEQTAYAIENAISYRRDQFFDEIARIKLAGIGNLDAVADGLFQRLRHLVPVEHLSLFVIDPDHRYRLCRTTAANPPQNLTYEAGQGLTGTVARTGRTLVTHDLAAEPEWLGYWTEVPKDRIRGWIGVPIVDVDNRVIGVLRALNKQPLPNCELYASFSWCDKLLLEYGARIASLFLSLSRFAARKDQEVKVISHEFMSPVQCIANSVKVMQEIMPRPQDQTGEHLANLANEIRSEAERLQGLRSTLSVVMGDKIRLNREPTALWGQVINYCWHRLRRTLREAGIPYEALVRGDGFRQGARAADCVVAIDRNFFRQVFYNLFQNSIKYSKDDKASFQVRVDLFDNEPGWLRLDVSDCGVGIAPGVANAIFNVGVRGPGAEQYATGSGYGLFICRRIVEEHGGRIAVKDGAYRDPFTISIRIPKRLLVPEQRR